MPIVSASRSGVLDLWIHLNLKAAKKTKCDLFSEID